MSAAARKKPSDDVARRELSFRPRSLNEEEMTVEAIVATESPVDRFFGREILACDQPAIDVTRLVGMPLLDSHNRSTALAVIGRVESYRIAGRKLICTLRFATSANGRAAFELVQDGMLSRVSIGYSILEFQDSKASDGTRVRTATKWLPVEVSLVGVPADHNSKIRGLPSMPKANRRAAVPPADDFDDDIDEVVVVPPPARQTRSSTHGDTITRADMTEINDIRRQTRELGVAADRLDAEFADVSTVAEARSRAFDLLAERSRETRTNPLRTHVRPQAEQVREMAVDALAERFGAPSTLGDRNTMRGMSLGGIVRSVLSAEGVSTDGLRDHQVIERAFGGGFSTGSRGMHTTSDFPDMLVDSTARALMTRFHAVASVLKALSTQRNASDFRPQTYIRPGEAPDLDKVTESGEVKRGTFETEKQGFLLEEYAKIFSISRKALVNDDLGVFTDFVYSFAESAARTEAKLFHSLLSANNYGGITLADGNNLFHASHGNLAAVGTVIDVTNIGLARKAMREQKNVNKSDVAGTPPTILLVGPAKQTEAEMAVAQISAAKTSDVNPFDKLSVMVEDRITGNNWYLFGDPQVRPAFVHGYLDGTEGPQVESREGWDKLGTEFRCLLDFGCGIYDWRAVYRNPGA